MARPHKIISIVEKGVVSTHRPRVLSSCVIADSPHSGRDYPPDFMHACDIATLRQAEDAYLDKVFDFLPDIGISFVQAHFPRSYIDPNRPDTAPDLVRQHVTPRFQVPIYTSQPSARDIFNRIAKYHKPYHQAIADISHQTRQRHGKVVHLNCHSMPSVLQEGAAPYPYDIVIGTLDGASAAPHLAEKLRALFAQCGYRVAINAPGFRGGEILKRCGTPDQHTHALQIEINRALYLDEKNVTLRQPDAARLRNNLKYILSAFKDFCDGSAIEREPTVGRIQNISRKR